MTFGSITLGGSYSGTEPGTPVTRPLGAVYFDFAIERIRILLDRGNALGLRFHFNQPRPENPTNLYAAACGEQMDIRDPDVLAQDDYFKPDGTTVMYSRLPEIIRSPPGSYMGNTCVFFSRAVLDQYTQDPQVVALRLYVVGYGQAEENTSSYLSLVSVGLNSMKQPYGPFLRSEEPCPPNCPTGGSYP